MLHVNKDQLLKYIYVLTLLITGGVFRPQELFIVLRTAGGTVRFLFCPHCKKQERLQFYFTSCFRAGNVSESINV